MFLVIMFLAFQVAILEGFVIPAPKPVMHANWTICKPRIETKKLGWYWACMNLLHPRDCAHECVDKHRYLNGECFWMHCTCHCGML